MNSWSFFLGGHSIIVGVVRLNSSAILLGMHGTRGPGPLYLIATSQLFIFEGWVLRVWLGVVFQGIYLRGVGFASRYMLFRR